jgi:mono/diheme cytochrome c family protein
MKMGIPAIALLMLAACSKSNEGMKPDGAELYSVHCAGCHDPGPGHPGTMLLAELDRPVASLIGRSDLDGDYVHSVVRNGLVEMPPFRPTEISEGDLQLLITYLKSAKVPPKPLAKPAGG